MTEDTISVSLFDKSFQLSNNAKQRYIRIEEWEDILLNLLNNQIYLFNEKINIVTVILQIICVLSKL